MRMPFTSRWSRLFAVATIALVVAAVLVGTLSSACGGGGTKVSPEPDPEPEAGAGAEAGVVKTPPPDAEKVSVVLSEWAVTPDVASVPSGPVYFLASNDGGEAHEFVVIKTDVAPDALPTDDDGRVPEGEVNMIGEIEPFKAGTQASAVFTLEPGSYALICNIVEEEAGGKTESHYKEGMFTAFTVE